MPARLRIAAWLPALFAGLLLLAPLPAAAEGLNLAWSNCLGEGTGVQNLNFGCNTNSGTNVMVGSFVLGSAFPTVIGLEIIVDLAAASPTLPAWWSMFNAGTCRQNSIGASFLGSPGNVVCEDWSGGLGAGGIAAYCGSAGTCSDHPTSNNVVRLKLAVAVAQENARDLAATQEYEAFRVLINNAKTVGAGSCEGCATPVCIVLNSINVVDRGAFHERKLTTSNGPGTNFVSWQGGGVPVVGAAIGCPAATPTQRSTWGAVKSLYR